MHTSAAPTLSASFSVIAERFRRAGQFDRAVALCREGLEAYPDHLSARVTLGCALLDLGQHVEAHRELQAVLKRAPDNLAAIRGLADLHARGIDEQDAHDMQAAHDMQILHDEQAAEVARDEVVHEVQAAAAQICAPVAVCVEPPVLAEPAPALVSSAMLVEAASPLLLDELDPMVVAEPHQFEIEDVIAEAEVSFDFDDALGGSLDIDPPVEPQVATQPADPIPVPELSDGPIVVLDEWLTRIRARRSELLSEYAAS